MKTELEKLRTELVALKYFLIKWQLIIGIAYAVILAKGFGWLGFQQPLDSRRCLLH